MELREGIYTNDELAEWFGVKPASFRGMKKKKLIELYEYAEFYEDKGRIVITRVLEPIYCKTKGAKKVIKNEFQNTWAENGYDTCARVGSAIVSKHQLNILNNTAIEYTRQTRNELFGSPRRHSGGSLGTCYAIWCKIMEDGTYEPLTEEEMKMKDQCAKVCFKDAQDKDIILKALVDAGEISEADAWRMHSHLRGFDDMDQWLRFKLMVQEMIGATIIVATKIEYYLEDGESVYMHQLAAVPQQESFSF